MTARLWISVALSILCTMPIMDKVLASEGAKSTYLLGVSGPQAGMVPPAPGFYATNIVYIYSGGVDGNVTIPRAGTLAIGIDVNLVIEAPMLLWVPKTKVLGGTFGVFGLLTMGYVDAKTTVGRFSIAQSRFSVGDPQIGTVLGWSSGPLHWKLGTLLNIPVGQYELGALDNLSFRRWSFDMNGAVTWFDPSTGFELSGLAGVSFNGRNPKTDYTTGTEFHIELSALYHPTKRFQFGLVGYHFEQITGDSGSGAVLGAFKGRVSAVGFHVGGTIMIGKVPLILAGRVYREFNAKNRLTGTTGFLTVTVPLGALFH